MVTLKDIARLVGVSVPTVSKVLNNKSQKCASPETQNRIWQAVHDLGYTPNVHAKKLASISGIQTMKNIVAIYLWEDQPPFLANFYQAIRKKLEVALLSNKYIPYTCDLDVIFKKRESDSGATDRSSGNYRGTFAKSGIISFQSYFKCACSFSGRWNDRLR